MKGAGDLKKRHMGGSLPLSSLFFSLSLLVSLVTHTHTHTNTDEGLSPAMATNPSEESSPVPAAAAPQQPGLEARVEPGPAVVMMPPEPSQAQPGGAEKEDEEDEDDGGGSVRVAENAGGQSVDPERVEERFRIDRKKLENMLYGE